MDLDEQELYWTRKMKGLVTDKETERYIRSLEKKINDLENENMGYYYETGGLRTDIKINYIPKSALKELLDIDEIGVVHCRIKQWLE